jgi:hypothetical protein
LSRVCVPTLALALTNTLLDLDGGPRKWTYQDPRKPMTYQQY